MIEPNACKMCGSRSLILDSERKYGERGLQGQMFCVTCLSCGAQGPWADTETMAVEGWNNIEEYES